MKSSRILFIATILLSAGAFTGFSLESMAALNSGKYSQTYSDSSKKIKSQSESRQSGRKYDTRSKQKSDIRDTQSLNESKESIHKKAVKKNRSSSDKTPFYPFPGERTMITRSMTFCTDDTDSKHGREIEFSGPLAEDNLDQFLSTLMSALEKNSGKMLQNMPADIDTNLTVATEEHFISGMLYHAEKIKANYPTVSPELLPDFVATHTLSSHYEKQSAFLFERKTAGNIELFMRQKEVKTYFYIIARNDSRDYGKEFVYEKLMIKTNGKKEDGVVYFLHDGVLSAQCYTVPIHHLPKIVELCEQWGNIHGKTIGVYEVIKNEPCYSCDNYDEVEFNDDALNSIVTELSGMAPAVTIAASDQLLTDIRADESSVNTEKVNTPFVDWYQQTWTHSKNGSSFFSRKKPHFVIEMMNLPENKIPASKIVVAQLNKNQWGVNLLGSFAGYYLVLDNQHMDKFAKQLMWIAKHIEVYKIK